MVIVVSMCSLSGQRLSVVEAHCVTLRMLYRDSSRPPPPIVESQLIEVCT